jgi:peptide/nickel transport system permease protein
VVLFALPARLPGGTEEGFLGNRGSDPIARAKLRSDLHLDQPLPLRFLEFVDHAVHGNLGRSPVSGVDVGAVVGERTLETLVLAVAALAVAFALAGRRHWRRRRRRRVKQGRRLKRRARWHGRRGKAPEPAGDEAPAPSAVPGAVWALPLLAAVIVADQFGAIPAVAAHAAIASRFGASLLPAIALGVGLALWLAAARRTTRDLIAAAFVATLVTEAVFDLPGLGALLRDAAMRSDLLMVRGALLAASVVAVVAAAVLVPVGRAADDVVGGPSARRRAAGGTGAVIWVGALVVATIARLHLGLAPAARVGSDVGAAPSSSHPFGTDALGRDVMARVLATGRGSLLLVIAAMLVAAVLGTVIGTAVGFAGGRWERLGLAVIGGWAAFPGELVAVALLAFNGRSGTQAALALALVAVPALASSAQRRTLDARQRSEADLTASSWFRGVGSGPSFGLVRATLATMFVGASRVVVAELVAGVLGFGPAATQTWSHEIVTQLAFAERAPLAVIVPVAVALVTAVSLAALGNSIRPARGVEDAS